MKEALQESTLARCAADTTPRDRRNLMRLLGILAVWAVLFVGASQLIKRGLLPPGPLAWAAAALPIVAGIFVCFAYLRYLREADELQRLVQLQALALGFGGGFFAIAGYALLERLGAPVVDVGDATIFMAIFYSLGAVLGQRRYR